MSEDGTAQWPPAESLDDVGLLALSDPRNLRITDGEGNEVQVTPVYPAHEMTFDAGWGWTARKIYEDRVVELEWDDEECQWQEPSES